ncbi:MAG: YicC family protein [Synergistaceae bacterium]|nr:YicC family protein [Synergistaceae bacterium]
MENKKLLSMTGFSRLSVQHAWGTMNLEISSVNHRYQEISVRMPREFSSFEPLIISKMRSMIGRGKIRASVEILWNPEYKMVTIDSALLTGYWKQLRRTAEEIGSDQDIHLTSLLNLPGVCDTPRDRNGNIENEVVEAIISKLTELIDSLTEMKIIEGNILAKDISLQLESFSNIIDLIDEEWQSVLPEALAAMHVRLEKFLSEAAQGVSADPARIAQEIAIMSDKWDISEEIVRSRSHIDKFREMMAIETCTDNKKCDIKTESTGIGRKLDFLIQEMNREINTMGSKMQNARLRWRVVEAKACIERIREQIQNID